MLWEKEKLLFMSNFSFSHSFQKACFPGASKGVIVWEWVKFTKIKVEWIPFCQYFLFIKVNINSCISVAYHTQPVISGTARLVLL